MQGEIIVRPFKPEDLAMVNPHSELIPAAADMMKMGTFWTATLEGYPVLCAGILTMWPGLGEAWAVLSQFARAHPMWMHRLVKRKLNEIVSERKIYRVQMHVDAGDQPARRWGETLGFKYERTVDYKPNPAHVLVMWR